MTTQVKSTPLSVRAARVTLQGSSPESENLHEALRALGCVSVIAAILFASLAEFETIDYLFPRPLEDSLTAVLRVVSDALSRLPYIL